MASITRYKDKWRAQIFKHGQRVSKVFATKREAQDWALKTEVVIEADLGHGNKTLRAATTHYLETVSTTKSESAKAWETKRFEAMLAHFGEHTRLAEINSERIGQWRDSRLKAVTGSTILREANLLRHLFSLAIDEWKWMTVHPFKGVRMPKENDARHQLWHWQQIKRVLRAGQRSGGKIQETTDAFHISLRTGMRLQECLAAPAHFDKSRRVVTVKTKTAQRGEEIPIGRVAAKLLDRPPFKVNANEASVLFSKLVSMQMLGDLHFHDARATALTLLAKKVDVMVLARVSRHKDISLLHRVYYRTTAEEIASKL